MYKHLGVGFLVGGVAAQVLISISQEDALLNNIPFQQTSIGAVVPSPNAGWYLMGVGLLILFIVPFVPQLKGA